MGLSYQVHYKKGRENRVADALSRRWEEADLANITIVTPTWIDEAKESYIDDPKIQKLIQQLQSQTPLPNYRMTDGLIQYKGKLLNGKGAGLRERLIEAIHTDPNKRRSSVHGTYQRAKGVFYWKGLKGAILDYVTSCDKCQKNKAEHTHSASLLQPLPVPNVAWKDLTMDFIEELPKSEGKEVILVIVNRFTKYANFIPLSHLNTAPLVAQSFLNNVYKLHGLPNSIVTDRDKIFTSQF